MSRNVQIYDVAPRDGLQNHPVDVSTEDKIHLIHLLQDAGLKKVEVASFVSPKWVPKMADGAEVLAGISRKAGVTYGALVPNLKGLERAIAAKPTEIAVFVAASESFSQKNTNCSIEQAIQLAGEIARAGLDAGLKVRGYVSCVTDCPYEGAMDLTCAGQLAETLIGFGCHEVSLGDTIGHGTPDTIAKMLDNALQRVDPTKLAAHFHDTKGRALDNIEVALDRGLRTVDASVGGLGGCPYAPGAAGNAGTVRVHDRLTEQGWNTGLDSEKLTLAAHFAIGFGSQTLEKIG